MSLFYQLIFKYKFTIIITMKDKLYPLFLVWRGMYENNTYYITQLESMFFWKGTGSSIRKVAVWHKLRYHHEPFSRNNIDYLRKNNYNIIKEYYNEVDFLKDWFSLVLAS